MEEQISADVDATDPVVVLIAWILTQIASHALKGDERVERYRSLLPALAVVIAVGARAALDAASGEALTVESVLRALAAAGVAVLAHSQGREIMKQIEAMRAQ